MDEGRKISYYRDAAHNYMVLECPPELKDNYQYKMLAANRIRGLLSCSGRSIDSREYLYYDISSRQNLTDLYDRRPVRSEDLYRILKDLVRVEETLTEYLLDTSHLILDPSCVYMDFREQECGFVYYPGEEQEKGPETLFSFLADRVEGRDKQAAALIYRLCMMAEKPGFRLRSQVLADLGMQIDEEGGRHDSRRHDSGAGYPEEHEVYVHAGMERQPYIPGYSQQAPAPVSYEPPPFTGGVDGRMDLGMDGTKRTAAVRTGSRFAVYEEGNRDKTDDPDEMDSRTEGSRSRPWKFLLTGLLSAAGIGLFLSGRFLNLGERETLLALASGSVLAVGGTVLLILQILRVRKEKTEQNAEAEAVPAFVEPEHWETRRYHPSDQPADSPGLHGERGRVGTKMQNAPDFYVNPYAVPGETCLLGPDTGPAAGLYGTGNCRGEQISLASLPCVVGKMREYVDQVLDDSSVSRMHARFSLDRDGKMTVRDLNSTNGTWLNGERLLPNETHVLQQGDHLRFGRLEFVFR